VYFDEKNVDPDQYKGPLATSASVVSGVTAFAAVSSEKLNVSSNAFHCFSYFHRYLM
jgi:oligosaccharyltransferase complex subunit delta (ribophorin II)